MQQVLSIMHSDYRLPLRVKDMALKMGVGEHQFQRIFYMQTNMTFKNYLQGIAKLLNIDIGQANRMLTFIILVLVLFVDKKYINIGSILAVVFTGTFLALNIQLVDSIFPEQLGLISSITLFILACFPVSIGFPIL